MARSRLAPLTFFFSRPFPSSSLVCVRRAFFYFPFSLCMYPKTMTNQKEKRPKGARYGKEKSRAEKDHVRSGKKGSFHTKKMPLGIGRSGACTGRVSSRPLCLSLCVQKKGEADNHSGGNHSSKGNNDKAKTRPLWPRDPNREAG